MQPRHSLGSDAPSRDGRLTGTAAIAADPLTRMLSVHPDTQGKYFPHLPRHIPAPEGPCVFCTLEKTAAFGITGYVMGEIPQHVYDSGQHALTIDNRWPPFGPDVPATLVLPRRHVTSLEELTDDELAEMFEHMFCAYASQEKHFDITLIFINVGIASGASQAHLHAQVVSIPPHASATHRVQLTGAVVEDDISLARNNDLVIFEDDSSIIYAPAAPMMTGEIRVVSTKAHELAEHVRRAVSLTNDALGPSAYNVIIHVGPSFVAQVLNRTTHSSVYPIYLDLNVIANPPGELARLLRAARA